MALQKKLEQKKVTLDETKLSTDERRLVEWINNETVKRNRNNVTRTKAYFEFYEKFPEVHWALLGHLVSRNGGWTMTDLKGEFLPKLLTEKEQADFFHFLESGNWLIFQDAYPQFLVYAESLLRNRSMFHLLPLFNVSSFMEVVWHHFWQSHDRYLLAIAMVINEQSYLEQQVVQNEIYKGTVLNSIEFNLQELLNLNHILFPVKVQNGKADLVGQTVHHFASVTERIRLGKRLYSILFDNERRLNKILSWAKEHPHTGSRKDYWPHLFNDVKETLPGRLYNPQTKNCTLKQGASHLFSPQLQYAWPDVEQGEPLLKDWFNDLNVVDYLKEGTKNVNGEIVHAYCKTLEAFGFAVFAKKAIFLRR